MKRSLNFFESLKDRNSHLYTAADLQAMRDAERALLSKDFVFPDVNSRFRSTDDVDAIVFTSRGEKNDINRFFSKLPEGNLVRVLFKTSGEGVLVYIQPLEYALMFDTLKPKKNAKYDKHMTYWLGVRAFDFQEHFEKIQGQFTKLEN